MGVNLLTVTNTSWMYSMGLFFAIVIPFILVLIIARFRGFFASLFFLPFYFGLVAFILTYGPVNTFFEGIGNFGLGMLDGFEGIRDLFLTGHCQIVEMFLRYIPNETFARIMRSRWAYFLPYFVAFVILFALVHKRKKKNKEFEF